MTGKNIFLFGKRALICLLAGTAAGILLLLAVYLLPTAPMTRNVQRSEEITFEGAETFTDAIILESAIDNSPGKSIYERAMMIYRPDVEEENWDPEGTLQAIREGRELSEMYSREYARYWHGYLVLVKPLLLIFTANQLVAFLAAVQIILLLGMAAAAKRVGQWKPFLAVFAGWLFMKPLCMASSITMSLCWIITLTGVLYMMLQAERIQNQADCDILFLVTGMVTSYMDLLTYPVVTLGFLLGTLFLLRETEHGIRESLWLAVRSCLSWGIGYIGLWGMKWLVSDLTLHRGTIKDALWTVIGRTEAIGGRPRFNGAGYAITLNFREYESPVYAVAAIVLLLAVILGAGLAVKRAGAEKTGQKLLPFLVVFVLPFGWILVAQNHSALHAGFTFRILAVAVSALVGMGLQEMALIREKKRNKF